LIGAKIDPKTIANILKEKLIIVKLHYKKLISIKGGGDFRGLKVGEDRLDLI
jgi:hypothetical protein